MIGILNYGSGNLKSLSNALNYLGIKYKIIKNKNSLKKISKLIIPGVGSYKNAMNKIERNELIEEIKNSTAKIENDNLKLKLELLKLELK